MVPGFTVPKKKKKKGEISNVDNENSSNHNFYQAPWLMSVSKPIITLRPNCCRTFVAPAHQTRFINDQTILLDLIDSFAGRNSVTIAAHTAELW